MTVYTLLFCVLVHYIVCFRHIRILKIFTVQLKFVKYGNSIIRQPTIVSSIYLTIFFNDL